MGVRFFFVYLGLGFQWNSLLVHWASSWRGVLFVVIGICSSSRSLFLFHWAVKLQQGFVFNLYLASLQLLGVYTVCWAIFNGVGLFVSLLGVYTACWAFYNWVGIIVSLQQYLIDQFCRFISVHYPRLLLFKWVNSCR